MNVPTSTIGLFPHFQLQEPENFLSKINSFVSQAIEKPLEALGSSYQDFIPIQEDVLKVWNELLIKKTIKLEGKDDEVRPSFVSLQAIIEHVLVGLETKSILLMIHTPTPATPLCMKEEKITEGLASLDMQGDAKRLMTIKARSATIRKLLDKKGVELYVCYPKEGLKKRTAEQQQIYLSECKQRPYQLFDRPLNCSEIDSIGATYLIKDQYDQSWVFSIQINQANNPLKKGNFGLWFGSLTDAEIQERVTTISAFIKNHTNDPVSF
jgi:hypothetical protein